MLEPRITLGQRFQAAAALLLREPDAAVLAGLEAWRGPVSLTLEGIRQDFYDVFCISQSGRYVPPYEHVVKAARREGDIWFFPPARYDGGDVISDIYREFGFTPSALDICEVLRAPHLPADHIGFMFAFLAGIFSAVGDDDEGLPDEVRETVSRVVSEHMGPWVGLYSNLVADRGGLYFAAVAHAVREAVALAREEFGPKLSPVDGFAEPQRASSCPVLE